jgi:hypothetical protein
LKLIEKLGLHFGIMLLPYSWFILGRSQGIKLINLASLIQDWNFAATIYRNNGGVMLFAKAVMPAILNIACPSK